MKQLVCEMCGSTNLIKQDGSFVCQSCGVKYSVEEARKMMQEIGDAVPSTQPSAPVSSQNSVQLENLLKLAHSSFDSKNFAQTENFCNQIIAIDDKNYDAWKLKGEAINLQISSTNPRILEAYNCIMTSYEVLDDQGKEEHKQEILDSIKNCLEGEVMFWLRQMESGRPTAEAVAKVKSTVNDALHKINGTFRTLGIDGVEKYKNEFANAFIKALSVRCVSTWKTTVGYNYYRDSFEANNHFLDVNRPSYSSFSPVTWRYDDYRPDNGTLNTFMVECDNLINLLIFATELFNEETKDSEIISTYENAMFLHSHVIYASSFKRMVSTTTNGYGAITNRHEYWSTDKFLSDEAIKSRKYDIEKYKNRICELIPTYKNAVDEKNKREELEGKISSLTSQIDSLPTKSSSKSSIVVCVLCAIAIFNAISLKTYYGLLGLPIVFIVWFLLKRKSEKTIEENKIKKIELMAERAALEQELAKLK